jgi:hypothetical protein
LPVSQETNISSFLLRFIDDSQSVEQAETAYRGVIRHIQSGDELSFTRWVDVENFIQQYFPVEDLDPSFGPKAKSVDGITD